MKKRHGFHYLLLLSLLFCSCKSQPAATASAPVQANENPSQLAKPYETQSVTKMSKTIGWPAGKTPVAPQGFRVSRYAELKSPRWLHVLPNGDVLVSQAKKSWAGNSQSPNRITLLRGVKADGSAAGEHVLIDHDLQLPFGMQLLGDWLYVADTEHLVRFPFKPGQTEIKSQPQEILKFPEKGYHGHWTRNVIASPDGKKLYIAIGSASNVAEDGMAQEHRRANVLEVNPDGSGERVFASGLRNPIGIAFYPGGRTLWAVVNERDELGDELVPDYLTSVREGGFYGWPYSYFGQHEDPRHAGERPDLVKKAIVPDLALGAHVAALGLTFYDGSAFPEKYRNGAFIGMHGSWNRSKFAGYQVAFVPFVNGKPAGGPEDFLTGFIANEAASEVYGRPVGVAMAKDGALLVADDEGNAVWRVAPVK